MSLVDDDIEDAGEVGIGELVVHGQADDGVSHAGGVGQVLAGGAGQALVGGEGADQRIEVAAGQDTLLAHLEVELISRHAIPLGIDKDGKIAVVVAHTGHVVPEVDALDGPERLAVADGDLMAGLDAIIHMLQVQQAEGGPHLVHLAVDAGCYDLGLTVKAEVLEVVDALLHFLVVHDKRAALDGVIDLGGMETQGGHVALVEDALAIDLNAKGMGGVIDDAQAILVGNGLNLGGAAGLAIDVHGHDGRGARGDGGLDAVGIDASCRRVNIDEHRLDAVPPDRMGGGDKAVGRGDDLAADVERLQRGDERQRAVGEKADVGHLEVVTQRLFQPLVERAVIGNPLAVPNLAEHLVEVVQVGQQGRCYGNFIHRYRQLEIKRGSPGLADLVDQWRAGKAGDTIAVVIISELPLYVTLRNGSIAHGQGDCRA